MNEWAKKYTSFLLYEKGLSEKTVASYNMEIHLFYRFLEEQGISYKNLEKEDVRRYLKHLDETSHKNSSVAHSISSLRRFYSYLVSMEVVNTNVFDTIHNPKKVSKLPNFLSYQEVVSMIENYPVDTPIHIRNRLVLEILYDSGMRVEELTHIKLENISFEERKIKIVGKGNKERFAYYGEYAEELLSLYLKGARGNFKTANTSPYLFISDTSICLTTRRIEQIVEDVAKEVNVGKNVTPHVFRHSFATHLLNEDVDIRSVQELLGHENLKATQIYTHVTMDKLQDTYHKTHPRA